MNKIFKNNIPKLLIEFYEKNQGKTFPCTYRFPNQDFILEIQYLLDINDSKNYNSDLKLISFAINSDGHKLLIDLKTDKFEIFQNEFGDIDSLGIYLENIL